jgi:hypothetical protein
LRGRRSHRLRWQQHDLLWPLSMSYDASASRGDSAASTWWELMRNAVSQEAPVPERASRRRRSVHVSHSSFADLEQRFTIRLTTSSRNGGVAGLLNSLESQVTQELRFPLVTQDLCQHARVAFAACWLQAGDGIARLRPVDLVARRSIRQHQRQRPGQTPGERVAP